MTINIVNDEESLISPLLSQQLDEETIVPIGDESTCEGLVSTWKSEEPSDVESDTVEESSSTSLRAWKSVLLLYFVAILWGSQHAVIKSIVDDHGITPNEFSFFRFFLSTMIVAPYTPSSKSRKTWRWGAEMGLYMFAGYAMQAVGLQYTTAQKSGFLLYLNVKFVPIINAVIFRKKNNHMHVWLSAFIAFVGTALLTISPTTNDDDEASRSRRIHWNIGDLWSIGAAIASAMYIIRLEHALQQLDIEEGTAHLNSASLWVVTVLCLVWNLVQMDFSIFTPSTIQHLSHHIYPILYLSFIVTALANQIQSIGQRTLSAERASIIYAMDPVFGAIFSYILLGEKLYFPWGYIGAALITIAAVTNAFIEIMKKHKKETNPTDNKS